MYEKIDASGGGEEVVRSVAGGGPWFLPTYGGTEM